MAARVHAGTDAPSVLSQHLLLSVAEQLKLPLLQISRQAELGKMHDAAAAVASIQTTAQMALHLIDSYVLGVRLASQESELFELEPVSISSVLYDAGNQLGPIAKAYDVQLDLRLDGKYGPVMANRQGLQSALVSLGYALIEALPAIDRPQLRLQLAAHRCRYGIVAGMYSDAEEVSAKALRQGRLLHGRARQPMTDISASSGAGVFVADAILHAMSSQLTVSKHHKLHGIGVVLQPNPQMQLV